MNPAEAMAQVTQSFAEEGITPYEVNNGNCDAWAEEVLGLLGETGHKVQIWATPMFYADTTHIFLRIDGKFYDAECSAGVDDHNELPIFAKLIADGLRRQPVWCEDANHELEGQETFRDIDTGTAALIRQEQIEGGIPEDQALNIQTPA